MSDHHKLKILEEFADAIYLGYKTFEVRKNDRDYKVGDTVEFTAVGSSEDHPIRWHVYEITYILRDWGIEPGYVAFSIKEVDK